MSAVRVRNLTKEFRLSGRRPAHRNFKDLFRSKPPPRPQLPLGLSRWRM